MVVEKGGSETLIDFDRHPTPWRVKGVVSVGRGIAIVDADGEEVFEVSWGDLPEGGLDEVERLAKGVVRIVNNRSSKEDDFPDPADA